MGIKIPKEHSVFKCFSVLALGQMIHKIYISTIAWFKNRYNVAKMK